jgi:hypothetical protein
MSFLDKFFGREPDDEFSFEEEFDFNEGTKIIPMSTLLRWYVYDLGVSDGEEFGQLIDLPPISEEGADKEKQDSDDRMARVNPYEDFIKNMAEISGYIIGTIQNEHLDNVIADHFPDASPEEIAQMKAAREEATLFLDQVGFAAALFTLSVGFEVGLLAPGPAVITKASDYE